MRWLMFALTALSLLLGCMPQSEETEPHSTARKSAEPSIHYVPMEDSTGMAQAVTVEGHPLVYTRQLLPLDDAGQLPGDGSAQHQVEQVLDNLQGVLNDTGSGLDQLVRLNIYTDLTETADLVRQSLRRRLQAAVGPAITAVQTPLEDSRARVALDAIAVAAEANDAVALKRCHQVAGDVEFADAAIMPPGGVVYLSGQPDKSSRVEATVKSLEVLLDLVDQLKCDRSQVVQLKVFVDSAAAAAEVRREVKRAFPNQLAPPVVFVEWIASAPIEIEMIVQRRLARDSAAEPVQYYNPPSVKPSPTFSRVALVQTNRQIYISGLTSRDAGNGEQQTRDVFQQLQAILATTDSDLRHLVKATYYVSDDDASDMLNQLRPDYYDPHRPPAASKVMVHGVGQPNRSLMMDMIAVGVH